MAGRIAVGIDLGTSNCLTAFVNAAGNTEIVTDEVGHRLVPSVVLFDDDRTVVGEEALLLGRTRRDRLALGIKRELGRPLLEHAIGGERFPPEVALACVLRKVRRDVERRFGAEYASVLAVPVYFTQQQRRAVAEAAEMAGLALADLIQEPVAATLAFGEHRPILSLVNRPQPKFHVLVFELGGYVATATLLAVEGGTVRHVSSEWNLELGGHDWDLRVAELLARHCRDQGAPDPHDDPSNLEQLMTESARAKLALSRLDKVRVRLRLRDGDVSTTLTREGFETATAELLEAALNLAERVVEKADLTWAHVAHVLLVGGATRMPSLGRGFMRRTGLRPEPQPDPDEAVARGAALYAAQCLTAPGRPATDPVLVKNVSMHHLGIEGRDPLSGKRINRVLIPRGTPLPAKVTREFQHEPAPDAAVALTVLEGDEVDPAKCVPIGRLVLRELPQQLGAHWPIEITCEYDASGRLSIDARLRFTDRAVHLELQHPRGTSASHVHRWQPVVEAAGGLAGYLDAAARDRRDAEPHPVVLATSGGEPETPRAAKLSVFSRLLPFAFGKDDGAQPES